jgi:hypothetical protein
MLELLRSCQSVVLDKYLSFTIFCSLERIDALITRTDLKLLRYKFLRNRFYENGMIYFYSCTLVFSLLLKIQTILLLYSKKGNEKCEVECCGSEERMDWHEKV